MDSAVRQAISNTALLEILPEDGIEDARPRGCVEVEFHVEEEQNSALCRRPLGVDLGYWGRHFCKDRWCR